MDVKFEGLPDSDDRIVYVREVSVDDLPDEIRPQLAGLKKLYAVHNERGERLALVRDRHMAFVLARQNDLSPVTVH